MSEPEKFPDQMPEEEKALEEELEEEQEPYVPSSPTKRIIAWVAVVYMVMIVLLNVYPFFHMGEYLYGVFPLFVCPAAVGLFVLAMYRLKLGLSTVGKVVMVVLAAACVLLFLMGLSDGLPYLIAGLGG